MDLNDPHIIIPFRKFFDRFIKREQLNKFEPFKKLFTRGELRVLRELRDDNVKRLVIKKRKGEIVRIDATEEGQLTPKQTKEIKQLLNIGNYEKITLDTVNNERLEFERTKKIMI